MKHRTYYIIQRNTEEGFLTAWFFDSEESAKMWRLSGWQTITPVMTFDYETNDDAEMIDAAKARVARTKLELQEAEARLAKLTTISPA